MATGSRQFNYQPLKIILGIIAALWIVLFISWAAPSINAFGIRPRSIPGLIGILASPFLHGSIVHLAANTTGLFFLGLIFLTVERARAGYIIIPIYVLSGLGTWIIGRSGSVHIGASGVIYGLLGYLLFIGIFRRSFWTILMSAAILLLYGGALWGVLPQIGYPQISWEGHLSGFLAGIVTAKAEANMTSK
ncbi:MAG TPA: rhomboid family intramembrane serine protease [Spirochaetota bacterium]|nr:rhomboid family intramembrane serine protease [Spirochaetota bacterium]